MKTGSLFSKWFYILTILLTLGGLLGYLKVNAVQAYPTKEANPQSYEAFFDSVISEQLRSDHIAGATVAVVKNGEVAFSKGYGYADVASKKPVQAESTIFFIGSDGKLFTWTAVMQLVEQGKIDLTTDINTYLDFEIPDTYTQPITLHHLMTHTAGFEEEFNSLFKNDPQKLLPLRDHLIRFMPERVYEPGEVIAYSNYGTALAGYIVERISGQSFEDYLSQHILQPLAMNQSFAGNTLPSQFSADLSKGYHFENGQFNPLDFEYTAAVPCAPIRTTSADVSRFMIAHLNGGCVDGNCILKPETVDLMHRQQFSHNPQMSGMAYGFIESSFNRQRVLWHLGESARFITLLALIPEENLGLVVSYNTSTADGHEILFRFLDAFYPVNYRELNQQPLPGWEKRANIYNGIYTPARSNHTTSQILVSYLQGTQISINQGKLSFNGMTFIETEPGVFHQADGDRVLVFRQDANGQNWFYMGILAYYQAPWYRTTGFILPLLVSCFIIFLSAWLIWGVSALRRNRSSKRPKAGPLWLASTLGIFEIGLLAWLVFQLIQYGNTYVYPQETITSLSWLFYTTIPWTIAVGWISVHAWVQKSWSLGWRIHYSLVGLAAVGVVWLAHSLNLFAKLI
jgi:CubicO group peptidase (beta-lactamase class C family)